MRFTQQQAGRVVAACIALPAVVYVVRVFKEKPPPSLLSTHAPKEVRIVVSHDGRLVSADLPSGTYTICEGISEGVYEVLSAEPTEQCSFEGGVANCGTDGGAHNSDAAMYTSARKSHVGALGG